ncbi:3-deoxy-manno-octulosonate-8-phosphatase protein [Salinisphaera shabanensis E1L3A]|uniref:3-deoxy-manno-octulosonate-8-phosphatase protein n=1 Tax=Salinisphaera shabanensis E1L3A TaxID=1033802 RepID=U2G3A4_9GAMM|nr:3-deoxy-manno-octulosonate-8-phosphatase protein [Salinisphaera shabanensis E1L3A]
MTDWAYSGYRRPALPWPQSAAGPRRRGGPPRLHALGVDYIYLDSHDKQLDFEALLAELELTPDQAAVMGDDLPDLGLMRQARLAMAVANAVDEVIETAHWVSRFEGGQGAVREACELIIAAHNAH